MIMREEGAVQVRSLRGPRDENYLAHSRPFSPTCTCEGCRAQTGRAQSANRPQSAGRARRVTSEKVRYKLDPGPLKGKLIHS